jgi:hypothetical protein
VNAPAVVIVLEPERSRPVVRVQNGRSDRDPCDDARLALWLSSHPNLLDLFLAAKALEEAA